MRTSKEIQKFNKIQQMASIPSSRQGSSIRDFTPHIEADDLNINFQQEEMKNIREKIFLKKVIKQLYSLISPNNMPSDISQQWQCKQENQNINTNFHQLPLQLEIIRLYPSMKIISILQGLGLVVFIWFLSIAIVFQQKLFDQRFFAIGALQLTYLAIKIWIVKYDQRFENESFEIKPKKIKQPLIIIISCFLMIVSNETSIKPLSVSICVLMAGVCIYLAKKVPKYFIVVKNYAQQKKLIKQLRIIQLFCVLLVVTHTFGLIMYSANYLKAQGQISWIESVDEGLPYKSVVSRYIYSVYFAITTIVTVGYGDLSPQNEAEVVVIMILQICGTSFFGYMINVIGITVDNINKKNEIYDNYQETISKLKDNYQLSDQLCYQMKRDVQNKYNRQESVISLNKNQQNEFLEYVDSTVKRNFILETNIRIIKKSIFFLTYFTVNFQNYVALKLIRVIYKKDQTLQTYDPITKQKNIVIINHGKVNMFIEKRQNNIIKNKLVRTIQPIEGKPTLNVIGYSSLILNMDIDLFSKASQMTSGYILKMSDVLECIDKSMIDYQSFHQMRQRMLLFPIKQSIEAPSLKDGLYHFTPNIFIISCRYNKKSKNKRQKMNRTKKRGFLLLDKVNTQLEKDVYIVNQQEESSYQEDSSIEREKLSKTRKIDEFGSLLSVVGQGQVQNIQIIQDDKQIRPEDGLLRTDQVKIFEYYMKNHNVNIVASHYEQACSARTYKRRIETRIIKKTQLQKMKQLKRESISKEIKKKASMPKSKLPFRL